MCKAQKQYREGTHHLQGDREREMVRKGLTKEENLNWNLKTLTKWMMEERRKAGTKTQNMKCTDIWGCIRLGI